MKRHLMILDPAAKTPELDCFNALSLRSPLPLTYHLPGLQGMDSILRAERGAAGLVILGSATSVYDNLPWQKELSDWLLPKLKAGTPALGICFGHQLIAHLWGAKVGFVHEDHRKLQGFRNIQLEPPTLWKGLPTSGSLFVSHRETVLECPASFRAIAKSGEIALEGLVHEQLPIFSLQAHPEATEGLLRNLGYTGPKGDFSYGESLVDAFLNFAASR